MFTRRCNARRWVSALLLPSALLLSALSVPAMTPERQATMEDQLEELAGLMAQEKLNPLEWTRGTYLAARFFGWGAEANPPLTRQFYETRDVHTATLSGLAYGQTVLAKACAEAGIAFDNNEAHSAAYDAERTAELFCDIVNRWKESGGWMPQFS